MSTYTRERFRSSFDTISLLTGEEYFQQLVMQISDLLNVDTVWMAEYHPEQNAMSTVAFLHKGAYMNNMSYLIEGTPCEAIVRSHETVHYPRAIRDLFPSEHSIMVRFSSESYVGASLCDGAGSVVGSVAILHSQPVMLDDAIHYMLSTIKSRSECELVRFKREREIRIRENQLLGLINGVQDLLINLNQRGQIVMVNATAESQLQTDSSSMIGMPIAAFLSDAGKSNVLSTIEELQKTGRRYGWLEGDLTLLPRVGDPFDAEGTLSRYELSTQIYYTLVLRRKIGNQSGDKSKDLIHQTEHLGEELDELQQSCQLIGESQVMKRLLQSIYTVANTDATVLINGETGTGKELVAQHIHQSGHRRNKPMIAVNCGAIPANLIESEFFGHAKGAFTGATSERKGRFQLAHGGTIFLDEIGELPPELQVKLLRVIQEGEFEPVGSSKTIKVDVRIIAATHRNLFQLSCENLFREDLYYRLNVFPIEVPPLRERLDDIALIAQKFIDKHAKRLNRSFDRLNESQRNILKSYRWPGNVRELQNVIERAAIMTKGGQIDLSALNRQLTPRTEIKTEQPILTRKEFLEFEKQNIIRALEATNWKVSGKDGAAALLDMVPSTLSSRINALGISLTRRPSMG
ncbi:sigma 54-interacting transcriptional regulator [Chryseolinea sp. T2]|uniref:sigma-54 interaction domain-containing protein n=1 Tax=Chryseolinea sp. T2 TaxID=3129255 RepID=UPI0030776310